MASNSSDTPRPKLVVFDLDYTLWPFWVDTHVTPPFHKKGGDVFDSFNEKVRAFPEVPDVLQWLHDEGYIIAAASRTGEIRGAKQLVKLFGWEKYFKYAEIYPGCKKKHFSRFRAESGLEYSEMIFFDDEGRNIRDLKEVGVVSVLVPHSGVTRKLVEQGLAQFAKQRRVGVEK
ncbi:magnesium-dependent phosphatase 1-like [Amphibalanus amphitrite]|uniref:magnesium-dependent phosphatase 1-like n=1 Tax=Amphibalanus amphitrite TaxID=1232801 RepID=UPI001C91ABCE|nr:magnesium-dependent phosphatase 1-like [Amphibalanus amphitrite]XP_043239168.1 magnesium-dependent phosphatase 1-like [Amphibalanus amphitrite]